MLHKFQFFGLIGYVLLTLFCVSAEYDPSIENSYYNANQVFSKPNVDNSFLRGPSLDSLSSSITSKSGIASSADVNIFQPNKTNTDNPDDNSPKVLTVNGSPSLFIPLISDTYSTSTNSRTTSEPSVSLNSNSETESTSSSTSVNFGSSSTNYVESITNSASSFVNSVSSSGNSPSSTGNSSSSSEISASSHGNSASSSGNYPSSYGNYPSSSGNSPSSFEETVSSSGNSDFLTGYGVSSTGNFPSKTGESLSRFSIFQPLKEDLFPNSFSNAALSVPFIQNFLNFEITGSTAENILKKVAFKVAKDNGHSNPADIAGKVSKNGYSFKVLTLPLYFQAVENSLFKFFRSEGIIVTPDHFKRYSIYIENALNSSYVNSIESVYQALSNGFVNFIQSLGFNILEKADILAQLFNTELIALRKS